MTKRRAQPSARLIPRKPSEVVRKPVLLTVVDVADKEKFIADLSDAIIRVATELVRMKKEGVETRALSTGVSIPTVSDESRTPI